MSAPCSSAHEFPDTLPGLLDFWRQSTRRETEAIERDDWRGLAFLHEEKVRLLRALDAMPLEDRDAFQPHLRLIRELQSAERANASAIDVKLKALRLEIDGLDQSSRALRDVRSAYGHGREALWQSYS
ncbi:MAG: hypothetical protein HYR88_18800 [Verrucomicrobia bacterium]|nr:hypothetical protein [Verrucomicrobiota bacterium]MBI3870728.1 hypothetical protein [Verrucomicrobiota bacterium]